MTDSHTTPEAAILVAVEIAKYHNDALIELRERRDRRRHIPMANTPEEHKARAMSQLQVSAVESARSAPSSLTLQDTYNYAVLASPRFGNSRTCRFNSPALMRPCHGARRSAIPDCGRCAAWAAVKFALRSNTHKWYQIPYAVWCTLPLALLYD